MNTLKKFISYYRPYRAVFYFDLFCAAVISVVDLAYPQLLRSLTKTLFTGNKSAILGALPWLFLILLIMYTIQSLCKYYVTCQGHIMGAKMERDMRKQLFEHYEKLSFSYYSTHNSGQMMSKLVSDLFDISELAHHGPENLFISLVKIIGSFVFLFLINQKLALPLLLLVILMILFSIRQNKKMQQTFLENRIRIGDINASLQDTLSGIRVVQSFANEDTELHKFNHSNEAFLESKKDNYRCMGTFMSSNLFFQGMMYLTTLIYGGYLIAMGQMQAADLAMYALYIGIFISPIQILVELVEMLQKGLSGFRRYLEVVETEPEIQDKEGAIDLENVKGDVCYDNVSFHYSDDNKTVLSQVSIHIPAGKSVALVGPSGGGKTTICSLLPRFYDVTAGKVTIDGKDVRDLTLKSLRNQIGMVQQDVYLFDGTIRENIAYGKPDATDEEIKEIEAKMTPEELQNLKKLTEEKENAIKAIDAAILRAHNEIDGFNRTLVFHDDVIDTKTKEIAKLGSDNEIYEQDKVKYKAEIVELKAQIEVLDAKIKELGEKLIELQTERDAVNAQYLELDKEKNLIVLNIEKVSEQIEAFKARRRELEPQLELVKEELKENGVDISNLVEIEISVEEITGRIQRLQRRMDELGDVNMRAIKSYDEVSERQNELKTKIDTLSNEKNQILDRMQGYENLKKDTFMNTYNNINDNFKEIFHRLSEGEGTLVLDNHEQPFTGGMSIEAQPRDKEKTRLNLMSGGEKSLTALAFVFAIQRYLPAPFYAFDEVDANLDGINVEKLADMVKTQAENTQFVVVSHRKPMIESANRTIGVTQKEKGITRVTGVKLRD